MDAMSIIESTKLVPVVTLKKVEDTIPTLKALRDGGVNVAEICYRTECAKDCIKVALKEFPDMAIGAGTVINRKQAEEAVGLGVKFVVSPGLSLDVADVCKKNNIPYLPGVVTPTEIMEALNIGLTTLKFFPAGVFGGLKAIKALGAAFPQVKFMPTGGADLSNLAEFIACDKVYAVGGSFMCKDNITENCKQAIKIVKGEN